jgi:DNA replication initiation complex subunit (GINS family)
MPESFMNRVDEIRQSLQEIADRLSNQSDHFEQEESTWRLEQVELKFSLNLEAGAGVVIARAKTTAGFEASLGWKSGSA